MDEKILSFIDEEIQEDTESTIFVFITDLQNDITHVVLPVRFVYLPLYEREKTLLEIKKEIDNIDYEEIEH
jgi:hypothetical protein